MRYLKDEPYYNELYDLFTIKRCLFNLNTNLLLDSPGIENLSQKSLSRYEQMVKEILVYFVKGERYKNKKTTIKKWIEKDRLRQEKYDNIPPLLVNCSNCDNSLVVESRFLNEDLESNCLKMLFFYHCPTCKKSEAIHEDGTRFTADPPKCSVCGKEAKMSFKDKGPGKTVWTTECLTCGYKEVDVHDSKEREKEEKKDNELLKKYRDEFCLSEKEGGEYISHAALVKSFIDNLDERKRKEADPAYQKAMKLKKLKITELEPLLSKALGEKSYTKLNFYKPEIDRYVIVPFTVQDSDSKRKEYDSKSDLKRLIKKILLDTNWRIMSEGIDYRLGYLSGRLKGYEREEGLVKIV